MLHLRPAFASEPFAVDGPSGNGKQADIPIVTIFPFNRFLLTGTSAGKDPVISAGKVPCSEKNQRLDLHSENRDVEFSGEIFLLDYRICSLMEKSDMKRFISLSALALLLIGSSGCCQPCFSLRNRPRLWNACSPCSNVMNGTIITPENASAVQIGPAEIEQLPAQ